MTTVLMVHPGASFSTADVHTGMKAGFEANGVRVVEFRLDVNLTFFNRVITTAIEHDILSEAVNNFQLACRGLGDMAIHFEPDVVMVVSGGNLHPMAVATLRELSDQRRRPFKTACYYTESPYFGAYETSTAGLYDAVFTNERRSVVDFQRMNPHAFYLPHAYNPAVHQPAPADPAYASDVFFVGTGFDERKALFNGVEWAGIDFKLLGYGWNGFDHDTLNPAGITDNAETARHYHSAAICLNQHRTTTTWGSGAHIDAGAAESLGPRAYEIAACGAFQLCDDSRVEYREVFGEAAASYRAGDSADLGRQVRWWLSHPNERAACAAAQFAAVQPHTWQARAADILTTLL